MENNNSSNKKNTIKRILCVLFVVFCVPLCLLSLLFLIMGVLEKISSMAICGFILFAITISGLIFSGIKLSKTSTKETVIYNHVIQKTSFNENRPHQNNMHSQQIENNTAKIIISRKGKSIGSFESHDVYLYNKYVGTLKNGKSLEIPTDVGQHMLIFKSKLNKKTDDTIFYVVVNEPSEIVKLTAEFTLNGSFSISYSDNAPHFLVNQNKNSEEQINSPASTNFGIRCINCGGTNLFPVSESSTKGKDFNASDALCGALLFGPLGLLCGATGKGKQTTTTTYWLCKDCGRKFRA